MTERRTEVLLWSIAFPGFGQILNGHVLKGFGFILLEVLINLNSSFNIAIVHSFTGDILKSIEVTNYQWLMFYPCVYMFAIWDAYRYADYDCPSFSFLPFVFSAYFVTVGLIYSSTLEIFGILFGPIWLPILSLIPGITIGLMIRTILLKSLITR